MSRRSLLLMASVWLTGAAAATSVGVVAVRQVASDVGDPVQTPLTDGGVRAALSQVPGSSGPTPAPTGEPTSSAPSGLGTVGTVTLSSGTVSARCHDGQPELVYALPADGYRTERHASVVVFRRDRHWVRVTLRCQDEELRLPVTVGDDPRGVPSSTHRGPNDSPTSPTPRASTQPQPQPSVSPEPSDSPDPSETERPH